MLRRRFRKRCRFGSALSNLATVGHASTKDGVAHAKSLQGLEQDLVAQSVEIDG
jgi:hypothetical protein